MKDFKVVYRTSAEMCGVENFEKEVNELLKQGYKIINTNSGVVNYPSGSSNVIYQAFLLKEDEE